MLHRMRHMYAAVASPIRSLPQLGGGNGAGGAAGAGGGAGGNRNDARIVAVQTFFSNVARRTTAPSLLRPRKLHHVLQAVEEEGQQGGQQMYRKVRLRYAVSSPVGSTAPRDTREQLWFHFLFVCARCSIACSFLAAEAWAVPCSISEPNGETGAKKNERTGFFGRGSSRISWGGTELAYWRVLLGPLFLVLWWLLPGW